MNSLVMETLQKDFIELEKTFHDQLFGIFNYGKANYNIDIKDETEMYVIALYIPSYDDLYYNKKISKDIRLNNHTITLMDIRDLENMIRQQDLCAFELLSTPHYIINKKYQLFFEDMESKKKRMFIDKKRIVSNFEHDYFYYRDVKGDLFMAIRLSMACELYLQGEKFEDCISLKKDYMRQYLMNVENGSIKPNFKEIECNFTEMKDSVELLTLKDIDSATKIMHKILINVLNNLVTEETSIDTFISALTDTENNVFNIILKEINYKEGNISISQLIETYGISRPVFKNVIQKMKDNNIGEINNMGAKGTHIKITNTNFLKD